MPQDYYYIAASYFIGSIPFAVIIAKLSGIGDITKIGSGNPGATNITRHGGKKLGLVTLLLDGGKGFLAAYLFGQAGALFAVLGHCFSAFLRFKGGKGVATTLGSYLALSSEFGLITCAIWLLGYTIFRISAVSALIALNISAIISWLFYPHFGLLCSFLAILVTVKHHKNIKELMIKL